MKGPVEAPSLIGIALCLESLHQEAVHLGSWELAHFLRVAAMAARDAHERDAVPEWAVSNEKR